MELKPCPFCGSENPWGNEECVCAKPDLMAMPRGAWNTRPIEDALRARIAELEANAATVIDTDDEGQETISFHGSAWIRYDEHSSLMDTTLTELYALHARVERYERALKFIAMWDDGDPMQTETAREALKSS
jgi:BMFP domain-containing protein YqiC